MKEMGRGERSERSEEGKGRSIKGKTQQAPRDSVGTSAVVSFLLSYWDPSGTYAHLPRV